MASEFVNKRPNSANVMAKSLDPENLSIEDLTSEKRKTANLLYSSKEYKKALEIYSELVELCPNVSRNYHNRAACYMMLYQYQGALADAKKSIELDPNFLKAYTRAIKCSFVLGDIVDAETTLSKLLELDPTNETANCERKVLNYVQTYLEAANNAYASKDFRQVVFCMDRCCDVSTHCKQFKLTKAECLAFLGRYQEAQDIANDVLHIDKQNADAIYIRGMCFYFQDYVERAFPHFQQVLRLAPDHTKALELYKRAKSLKKKKEDGYAAFKMERYQEAYNLYNEALGIDPQNTMTNAKLYFNKAIAAAKLGRLNESVANYTEALKLNVNYLKALLRRAASYMELKKYEEAVRDLEAACKIDKSRGNMRLLLEAKMALKISKRKDYYMILGIDRNASIDDIKKAYRKRAMVHHPDRHANASEGEKKEQEKKFVEVGEAYGILSDPKERLRYDNQDNYDDGDHNIDPSDVFKNFFGHTGDYQYQTRGFPSSFTFQFR